MSNISRARQIQQAIVDRLTQIRKSANYRTEAGLRVFRGRVKFYENEETPALSVLEGEETVLSREENKVKVRLDIVVTGLAEADAKNPLDAAHDLLEDLQRALFPVEAYKDTAHDRLDGLAIKFEYEGRALVPREDGSKFCYVAVNAAVEFVYPVGAV